MLLFAHVGITFGAAAAAAGIARRRGLSSVMDWPAALARYLDIRWLMAGSLLPDIIDKPLGQYLLPDLIGTGRAYAHTLLFLIVLSAAAWLVQRRSGRTWPTALALGTLTHLVLDQMWRAPQTLFWPLLGLKLEPTTTENWFGGLWEGLLHRPAVFVPEIIGFLVLAWFGLLLLKRRRFWAFLRRDAVA